jgi:hypothetical protein
MEEKQHHDIADTSAEDLTSTNISVASECQAIFRIIDTQETRQNSNGRMIFHVPPFPALDAIDPSEKLYDKRDELDADLVELLLCIDWKVNVLIKTLSPLKDEAFYPHRAVITEIGIKNITIVTPQPLSIGVPVEFHFVLPMLPFRELFMRGEVAGVSETEPNAYHIKVDANHMRESDREHMIHYIVKRQFQLKRERPHKR